MSQADQPGCDDRLFSASRRPLVPGPADLVPLEQNVVDRTFLMERLLLGTQYMGTVNVQQYINRMERIGGAPAQIQIWIQLWIQIQLQLQIQAPVQMQYGTYSTQMI